MRTTTATEADARNRRTALLAHQAALVAALEAELACLVAEGDEYSAHGVRDDLLVARSPARLIHKAVAR